MTPYGTSRILDQTISSLRLAGDNEINRLKWETESKRNEYRGIINSSSNKLLELSSNSSNQLDRHFLVGVSIVAAIVVLLLIGDILWGEGDFAALFAIYIGLPALFFFVRRRRRNAKEKEERAKEQQTLNEKRAEAQRMLNALDGEPQSRIQAVKENTDQEIEAAIRNYKASVAPYARQYFNNPLSNALARWLVFNMQQRIDAADRADYYPHIKVQMAYTVHRDEVVIGNDLRYNLTTNIGVQLDNSIYAQIGLARAVFVKVKNLLEA